MHHSGTFHPHWLITWCGSANPGGARHAKMPVPVNTTAALLERDSPAAVTTPTVLLLGNPNTGKTTVFNRLCGARAKTSNFPGTTTTSRRGRADFGNGMSPNIVDLPGIYELALDSP